MDKLTETPKNTETVKGLHGTVVPRIIDEEMKQSYLDYAMSVIIGRALPDVRDGLKPVHRRILYSMYENGIVHNKPYKKSARVVGDVLGKYHPHGDMAVYDALVRMAQNFSLRYMLIDGQGNFGCFTADTKVKLTDGRDLTFLELIDEWNQGKKNYTYTITHEGKVAIAEIHRPRKTKQNTELVKITLDNGHALRCTLNHKFLLKEGYYKEAQDLMPGDSLMPLYLRLSTKDDDHYAVGYSMVYQPKTNTWSFVHHLADAFNIHKKVYTINAGRVRHHKDFNKSNNDPDNIVRMQWKDHWMLHATLAGQRHEQDKGYVTKLAEGRKKFWSNEENRKNYAQRLSQRNIKNWSNETYRKKMVASLQQSSKEYYVSHPELKEKYSALASKTLKRLWKDEHYRQLFHEKIVAVNKRRTTNNTGKVKFLKICREAVKLYGILNEDTFEKTRQTLYSYGHATTWKTGFKKYFGEDQGYLSAEINHNHKVIALEFLTEKEDVYDLTIDDTHNFSLAAGIFVHNSIDGDNPAAMRYTECRLKAIAEEMLEDLEKETVSFIDNFDGSLKEPTVVPSKVPNLIVNGTSGIAVGMATNIPPHNLKEVCQALVHLVDYPEMTIGELLQYVHGPDFPTGGQITGKGGIAQAYTYGVGKIRVKATTKTEKIKDRQAIIVTEIPYMVNKSLLIQEIADYVKNKAIEGIHDLRDESDREGLRIVIELKKDADPDVVVNQLYNYTRMQSTFGMNLLALVDNEPKVMGLKELLQCFVQHRKTIVIRRTEFDLKKAEDRAHILEGLQVALDHIDAAIALIKASKSVQEAAASLMAKYSLTEKQSQAILDMKLQRLTSLEQDKIREEYLQVLETIKDYKDILAREERVRTIIKNELSEIEQKYGDERRTVILDGDDEEIDVEDLIKEESVVVTITHEGYIKRVPLTLYKSQGRGGKGVMAAGKKEEDFVEHLFIASTHDTILFFTNEGIVHWLKVYKIPEASRQAKGKPLVNLLALEEGTKITAFVNVKQFDDQHYLLMATRHGLIKKTNLEEYSRPRQGGIIAIHLKNDGHDQDQLVNVKLTDGKQHVILATMNGMAVKFDEADVRPVGRASQGVRGINLKEGDHLVDMVIAHDDKTLLTVTSHGYGKRTEISEYRAITRGGVGVINIQCTERNGSVVAVKEVSDDEEIMLISKQGNLIRTRCKDISVIGRNTQGLRLMKLESEDVVVAAARIVQEEETTPSPPPM